MKAVIAALLVACSWSGCAQAQSYYIRERITGTPTTTSTPTPTASHSWEAGTWSAPSSTCSTTAQQTRSVVCRKSDGTSAPDSSCTGTKPASTQTVSSLAGCTYTPTYASTWSACSNGVQTKAVTGCTRTDGASAALSSCDTTPQTQPCGKCGSFSSNTAAGGYTQRFTLGVTGSAAVALQRCNERAASLSVPSMCMWNSSGGNVYAGWPASEVSLVVGGFSATGLWSGDAATSLNLATCSAN